LEITERILEALEERQAQEGSLPELLDLYRNLLLLQTGAMASLSLPLPLLTHDQATDRLSKGIPLIGWDTLTVDWPVFQKLFQKSAAEIGKYADHSHNEADYLLELPLLQQVTKAWYENVSLSSWAETLGLGEDLLTSAIAWAIKPFLMAQADILAGLIKQEHWRRGYCPACGGKPDFAFLDKDRGSRWLLCSRCDTQWLFQRLECPYCGNADQKKLAFLTDEQERFRRFSDYQRLKCNGDRWSRLLRGQSCILFHCSVFGDVLQ